MHTPPDRTCWIIAGASGAVGRRVLDRLRRREGAVTALSRVPRDTQSAQVRWHRIDLYTDTPPSCPAAGVVLSAGPLDGLAACAAKAGWPRGTIVSALSSLSVETKADSREPYERAIAQRLRAAEAELTALAQRRGWRLHLLRASLIYDPEYGTLALDRLARLAGRLRLLPLPRDARGLRQPVHADDLAAALIAAAERTPQPPKVLRLPGGEVLRFDDMVRRWLGVRSVAASVLPVPATLGRLMYGLLAVLGGRAAVAAAQLARARIDQHVADSDWSLLGLAPRPFPAPERSRD